MTHWPARYLCLAVMTLCLTTSLPVAGQGTAENVELPPIDCYWRTSTDAVRVGEAFTLVLTCGVLDTAATTVVPDQSRLDPGSLQLQPFEVRGGTQAPDLKTPSRRFFQYEYQLRYVGEEIGKDLQLPPLTLTYRVQSRVQLDGAAVESRERQYILPSHAIRILSIVPQTARDIREASPVTLAEIDARRFRASMLRVASWGLFAIAAVVAVWGLVRTVRTRRTRTTVVTGHASASTILAGVGRELAHVRLARGAEGWTEALAARALSALRIGASYDANTHVVQTPSSAATPASSGQLRLPAGWPRGGTILISGAATAVLLAKVRQNSPDMGATRRTRLDQFETVLTRFSQVAYGRQSDHALEGLDEALTTGEAAISSIRREHSWLATRLRELKRWAGDSAKARGWARS